MLNLFGKSSEELGREATLEQENLNRRMRNEERIAQIKEEMGGLWIFHPSHKKSRLDKPRPV